MLSIQHRHSSARPGVLPRVLSALVLALCLVTHTTVNAAVPPTAPGDVIIDPQTGNSTVRGPVTTLAPGSPNDSPDMLSYIQSWTDAASKISYKAPSNGQLPTKCTAEPNDHYPSAVRAPDDLARTYAKFAGVSYCLVDSMVRSWTCLGHCDSSTAGTQVLRIDTEKKSEIKFVVAVNPNQKAIILSVRGTLVPINFLVDFSWVPLDYNDFPNAPKGILVHAGFLTSALRLGDLVRDQIAQLAVQYPDYTVDLAGHSLGGAIAQLLGLHIAAKTPIPPSRIRIFTYGSPRIGNPVFAHLMGSVGFKMLTRLTFNNDLVPHVPLTDMFDQAFFQHAPGEKYLKGWWSTEDERQKQGWLGWSLDKIRDSIGFQHSTKDCDDAKCEDATCSASRAPFLSILSHLRAFDVNFGPWC